MCSVYMLLAIALTHIHRLHQFVIRIFCYCVTFFCVDGCRLSNNFQCEIHAISMQHQVAHDFRIICTFFTCTPGFILNIFVEPFAVWMKCVTGILVKASASAVDTHFISFTFCAHFIFDIGLRLLGIISLAFHLMCCCLEENTHFFSSFVLKLVNCMVSCCFFSISFSLSFSVPIIDYIKSIQKHL